MNYLGRLDTFEQLRLVSPEPGISLAEQGRNLTLAVFEISNWLAHIHEIHGEVRDSELKLAVGGGLVELFYRLEIKEAGHITIDAKTKTTRELDHREPDTDENTETVYAIHFTEPKDDAYRRFYGENSASVDARGTRTIFPLDAEAWTSFTHFLSKIINLTISINAAEIVNEFESEKVLEHYEVLYGQALDLSRFRPAHEALDS